MSYDRTNRERWTYTEADKGASIARDDQSRAEAIEKIRTARAWSLVAVETDEDGFGKATAFGHYVHSAEDVEDVSVLCRALAESLCMIWFSCDKTREGFVDLMHNFAFTASDSFAEFEREG